MKELIENAVINNFPVKINKSLAIIFIKRTDKKKTGLPFDYSLYDDKDIYLGNIDIDNNEFYWRMFLKDRFLLSKIYEIEIISN